eukprot:scaffold58257_cov17-Tisochrysis_lutea.AAC.1
MFVPAAVTMEDCKNTCNNRSCLAHQECTVFYLDMHPANLLRAAAQATPFCPLHKAQTIQAHLYEGNRLCQCRKLEVVICQQCHIASRIACLHSHCHVKAFNCKRRWASDGMHPFISPHCSILKEVLIGCSGSTTSVPYIRP